MCGAEVSSTLQGNNHRKDTAICNYPKIFTWPSLLYNNSLLHNNR